MIRIGTGILKQLYVDVPNAKKIYVGIPAVWQSAVPISRPTSAQLNPSGTYNGSIISNGFSMTGVEYVRGNASGTNAGTYVAYYRPDDGHIWSDTQDRAEVAVTLTINKASGWISLSTSSTSCVSGEGNSFSVTSSHGGSISSSSNSGCIGTSASGNTINVWGGSGNNGATITVTCAATQNYHAASATCWVGLYFRMTMTTASYWTGSTTTESTSGGGYFVYNGSVYSWGGASVVVPYGGAVYVYGKALKDNVYHDKETCACRCYIDDSYTGSNNDSSSYSLVGSFNATHNMTFYIYNWDRSANRDYTGYGVVCVYEQY